MRLFLFLALFCVSTIIILHFYVYAESPPCRDGGPNGNLYKLTSDGKLLLDKDGKKILVPGYSARQFSKRCCNKKEKNACRNYKCASGPGDTYRHNVTPYKLGRCENSNILLNCKKCYYDNNGIKTANKPACEKDTWFVVPPNPPSNVCVDANKHKVTYNYDHSTEDDCF
ncbi:MAG: hypothetical protein LBP59_02690 [Planctomycetaceae bacterium]|jgi:hypothetical protein|nr:hypothetical protein [Planctomycetaceae bacterium]